MAKMYKVCLKGTTNVLFQSSNKKLAKAVCDKANETGSLTWILKEEDKK